MPPLPQGRSTVKWGPELWALLDTGTGGGHHGRLVAIVVVVVV